MNYIKDINLFKDSFYNMVIEIPKGTNSKYELVEPNNSEVKEVRKVVGKYPFYYGCFPQTYAGDKDPLDAILFTNRRYNSLDTLHTKLNEYCKCERFTIRETVAICEKIVHFCNHIKKKLDCEYLAYKICQKHSRNDRPQLALSMDHPFVINGTKQNLLTWKVPKEAYKIGHIASQQSYNENYPDFVDRRCSSYSDFYNFYTHLKNAIQEGFRPTLHTDYRGYYGTSQSFACNSNIIDNALNQMFNEIKAYQAKWDSDEKDDELKAYYNNIIEKEYKLHDCIMVEEQK